MGKFPKHFRVEFVRLQSIAEKHRTEIDRMKVEYGHHFPEGTVILPEDDESPALVPMMKYTRDLFYLAPFYHKELPVSLEKLLVIDVDLEIRIDLLDLHKHFLSF